MKEQIWSFTRSAKSFPSSWGVKWFRPYEFQCRCNKCKTQKVSSLLVQRLDEIRETTGRATTISSGFRCKAHNTAVGGASKSAHMLGKASDHVISGMPPGCTQKMEVDNWFKNGGVGYYNTFTHADTSDKRTWGSWKGCSNYKKYYKAKPQAPKVMTKEEQKIAELESKVTEHLATIKDLTSKLSEANKTISEQKKEIENLQKTVSVLKKTEERCVELESQYKKLSDRYDDLTKKWEACEEKLEDDKEEDKKSFIKRLLDLIFKK